MLRIRCSLNRQKYVKIPTITPRTSSKSVVRHDWNISMTKQFQQRMSRFLQRWRTQRNAIRNANCTISESSKLWTQLALPCGVCLLECLWIPHTLSSCHGSTSRRTLALLLARMVVRSSRVWFAIKSEAVRWVDGEAWVSSLRVCAGPRASASQMLWQRSSLCVQLPFETTYAQSTKRISLAGFTACKKNRSWWIWVQASEQTILVEYKG